MAISVFKLPFVGLIAKVACLGVFVVLVVVTAISYWSYSSLGATLEQMRDSNSESRVELVKLEARVNSARSDVNELLDRERDLRDKSEGLKQEAVKLERDWEVAKIYKRRVEESGRKIEELRQRIRALGR